MTETIPSWSDERVDLLRRLWQEGLSASRIATQLGGVSRNAVIGKIHRLGLSGRGAKGVEGAESDLARKPTREAEAPAAVQEAAAPARLVQETVASATVVTLEPASAALPPAQSPEPTAVPAHSVPASLTRIEPVAVAVSRRVTIMDLRESMCRWPLGDPTSPDFHYCGDRAITGLPYCPGHAQVAYQPAAERKRDRRVGGFR